MKTVITCPACQGVFGMSHTHAHTSQDVVDERFAWCQACRGRGATTCEKCKGHGRIYAETGEPAIDEVAALAQSRGWGVHPRPPRKDKR